MVEEIDDDWRRVTQHLILPRHDEAVHLLRERYGIRPVAVQVPVCVELLGDSLRIAEGELLLLGRAEGDLTPGAAVVPGRGSIARLEDPPYGIGRDLPGEELTDGSSFAYCFVKFHCHLVFWDDFESFAAVAKSY